MKKAKGPKADPSAPRRQLTAREFFWHPEPAGICLTLVAYSPIQPQT